jgi:hypothetical protein
VQRHKQREDQSRDGHQLVTPMRHPREHRKAQHQRDALGVEARVNQSENCQQGNLAGNGLAERDKPGIRLDSGDQAKRKLASEANRYRGNIGEDRSLDAHGCVSETSVPM